MGAESPPCGPGRECSFDFTGYIIGAVNISVLIYAINAAEINAIKYVNAGTQNRR